MHRNKWRMVKAVVVGLAIAALAAPGALAEPRTIEDIRAHQAGQSVRPNDRQVTKWVSTHAAVRATPSLDASFAWADAGIGAGSMLMLVLLGGGTTAVIYRQRRRLSVL